MANSDIAKGLVPFKHKNGAPYNGAVRSYYVPSTYGTALFIGDPVVKTGTSNTTFVQGSRPGSLAEINKSAFGATNRITGVIVGFKAVTAESSIYNPANTERVVFVADDPELSFEIQDDASATLDATAIGLNANLVDGAGNAFTGKSGVEFDASTVAADATFQLVIDRLIDREENDLGNNAKFSVRINPELHTEATGLGI